MKKTKINTIDRYTILNRYTTISMILKVYQKECEMLSYDFLVVSI